MQVANCQNQNQALVQISRVQRVSPEQFHSALETGCDAKWMDAATAGVSSAAAGSRYIVSKLTNPTAKPIFVKFR